MLYHFWKGEFQAGFESSRLFWPFIGFLGPPDLGILAGFGVSPKDSRFRLRVFWTSGEAVEAGRMGVTGFLEPEAIMLTSSALIMRTLTRLRMAQVL